jgi:mycothiol synthase
MSITMRPYAGLDDLQKMKALVVEGRKVWPHSYYPHVGDLDWWLYYGAFIDGDAPADIIRLWEADGELTGWVIFDTPEFDMAVHPAYRGSSLEEDIIAFAEAHLRDAKSDKTQAITAFAWADDPAGDAMLERRGYTGSDALAYFMQPLDVPLPSPILPQGFSFLEAMQPEWVDRRADVHFNSFNPSRMKPEAYTHFMTAPNYDPQLDIVVVAPDGHFASFAMVWIDPETKIGLFEPVGTRGEFQRRGLGKATLYEGMRRMQARGMNVATVLTHVHDTGNIAFYQSAGFAWINTVRKYEKQVAR